MKKIFLLIIALFFAGNTFADNVPLPQSLDKKHWLYFGWEESHPKAISLMGGAVYARRPKLGDKYYHPWKVSKEAWHEKSDSPVFFMLGVDGNTPFYPDEKAADRRKSIDWHLAEGYLPFPVSKWQHDNIEVEITHFGRRVLKDFVDVVYSQVKLRNISSSSHKTALVIRGEGVAERVLPLNKKDISEKQTDQLTFRSEVAPGKEVVYEFVLPANGTSSAKSVIAMGSYSKNYKLEKERILNRMDRLAMPVSLPDPRYINLWKSSMTNMWNATVKTSDDFEQRGSGGNVYGFAQYDNTFNHDIPDMAIQYILEGNIEMAKKIITGRIFEELSEGKLIRTAYLDAIPKYIMATAQYLQITGDTDYFDDELLTKLKRCSREVSKMRDGQRNEESRKAGVYGLIKKGSTMDNAFVSYMIVDNFAALHGFTAYKYICERFGLTDELEWVKKEMADLNNCLNNSIERSCREAGQNWYNACFSFDQDRRILGGPGNWLGTTFEMSTFPWNAYLKGFNLGGAWKDLLDPSVERWLKQVHDCGCPEGSGGAWFRANGSIYNVGMVTPLLYSEKYRTLVHKHIDWLLDNQTAPLNWGESFLTSPTGDWNTPRTDLETWGLGFIRQGMLQMCVSLHVDGTVILGRGIPDEWINTEKPIAWKNIRLNDGKTIDLSIKKTGKELDILIDGDAIKGNYLVNLPICKSNIDRVEVKSGDVVSSDNGLGQIKVTGSATQIKVYLKN